MSVRDTALTIVVVVLALTGCGGTKNREASAAVSDEYTVTDVRGVEVAFEAVPEKIVSLLPSNTEIIYALGLGDKLVAVSSYCNYPEEAKTKPKLDSGSKTNVEAIIGLDPDIVLMGKMAQTEAQYKQLEEAGIKLVVTEANNIAESYVMIEMLGKAFRAESKAAGLVTQMKNGFADIREQIGGKPASRVYIEISPVQYGPWTCGKGTFQDELLTLVGARNIFDDIEGWQKVSEEQVIERNPDFIITTDMYSNPDPVAEIKGRKAWAKTTAVDRSRVFLTDGDQLARPGPRLVAAAKELVSIIYK